MTNLFPHVAQNGQCQFCGLPITHPSHLTNTECHRRPEYIKASTCPGCGTQFSGPRGLRTHQSKPYVAMDCKYNPIRDGLPKDQYGVLRALIEHGNWPGSWYWNTAATTTRLLDRLVTLGLAQHIPATDHYRPTDLGRRLVEQTKAA